LALRNAVKRKEKEKKENGENKHKKTPEKQKKITLFKSDI